MNYLQKYNKYLFLYLLLKKNLFNNITVFVDCINEKYKKHIIVALISSQYLDNENKEIKDFLIKLDRKISKI